MYQATGAWYDIFSDVAKASSDVYQQHKSLKQMEKMQKEGGGNGGGGGGGGGPGFMDEYGKFIFVGLGAVGLVMLLRKRRRS